MAPFWTKNQLVQTPKKKKRAQRRAHDLENQDANQAPTQGFDLLQMNPNWFLGI